MAELIYSTKDIFTKFLKSKKYNIPEYQRGYKWNHKQIVQLLNDIEAFEDQQNDGLFYCLQNITLYPSRVNDEYLNVVDGQQRLTTIYLLFSYLELGNLLQNKFNYAVRESSNRFVKKIVEENRSFLNSILETKDFEEFCNKYVELDFDHQDIFYMYSAIKTFDAWFLEKNDENSKNIYKEKLVDKVKFIVNEIHSDIKEQELFMNLNTGKVPLDGADLVRAILITRVAREEMSDYKKDSIKDIVRLNEKRTRIGLELDHLNHWWGNINVKNYFEPFSKLEVDSQETIFFDLEINPINILYKLWVETKIDSKKKLKLKIFESTSPLLLYKEIIFINRTLQHWYNDRELYHYLGFLANNSRIVNFKKYYQQWIDKKHTKESFIRLVKDDVKKFVFGSEEKEKSGVDFWLGCLVDYNETNKTNWYESNELEKFLILIDVIEISKNEKVNFLLPTHFKKNKEDKEHIYPCTPKKIKELEGSKDNCKLILEYLNKLNLNKVNLFPYSENEWDEKSEMEKEEILNILDTKIHDLTPINSIGNLVLLNYSINRGFGNNYYIDKRASVVNNVQNGEYVRQHTLNVFVKGRTEAKDLNAWNFEDISNNANLIKDSLIEFFEIKTNN